MKTRVKFGCLYETRGGWVIRTSRNPPDRFDGLPVACDYVGGGSIADELGLGKAQWYTVSAYGICFPRSLLRGRPMRRSEYDLMREIKP